MRRSRKFRSINQGPKGHSVRWGISEEFQLRRKLAHIQRKLDRINELAPRLAIEAPKIQLADLIGRLRDQKEELVKELLAKVRKERKRQCSEAVPMQYPYRLPIDPSRYAVRHPTNRRCVLSPGTVRPGYLAVEAYKALGIQHDSTESYAVDSSMFAQMSQFIFRASLDDDAEWYRDDSPDWVWWGTQTGYRFPAPDCDAILRCGIGVKVMGEFTNAADDGGSGFHSVAFAQTDPNGQLPDALDLPSIQWVLLNLSGSGHYDSGWQAFSFDVLTKRHVSPHIHALLVTQLTAQDGLVEFLGNWLVTDTVVFTYDYA